MTSYRITTSGQVTVPAEVRRRWKTREVQVEDHGDHLVMRPVAEDTIEALAGIWKGRLRMTTDDARALIRRENAEIEDRKLRRLYGKP